uniref:CDK2-associated and cullin domain-containing protein 1 n=1 Tax=Phallusia mammillata TaxID=59560 RepID=A0A6F9D8Z5_9ASCI|nr:CDK2-associated and cullin domain-containing protein 1 [Phallusia mammillata]
MRIGQKAMKSVVRLTNGYQQTFKEHLHSVEKFCSDFSDLYAKDYYPKIRNTILEHLEIDTMCVIPSQETKFCFRQCIQHGYGEKLASNLVQTVSHHLTSKSQLIFDQLSSGNPGLESACHHVQQFYNNLKNFGRFIQSVSPLFVDLNSALVKPKLHTTMEEKLLDLFKVLFVEIHAPLVIECIGVVRKTPFALSPSILFDVASAIYSMKPDLRISNGDLFSFYIPNARQPLMVQDLEQEKEHIRQMQQSIKQDFAKLNSSDQKRSNGAVQLEDKECSHTMLSSLLMGLGT